jgi:hypothetical protein
VAKAVSGDTVFLQAGRHVLTNLVMLKEPITLMGEAAGRTQVDGLGKTSLFEGG